MESKITIKSKFGSKGLIVYAEPGLELINVGGCIYAVPKKKQ